MSGGIFLLDPAGELTEMAETAFAAELDLQKLLADHPGLLPGDQIDPVAPRRWLLVCREAGIPDQDQGGARWALDHLFLDQDGVPTLVEVKRGTDPRTRREVVGQMLDYAANCVLHWTAESIQGWLARRCQSEGLDPDEQIAHLLGEPAATGDFWQRVKTNLKAGKIRLLFVSDAIPPELRRIVEFLNEQMDPAEVLAVEIRQYTGKGLKTLVPRVLGQTTEAVIRKTGSAAEPGRWDEATFFADLTKCTGEEETQVAKRILEWAKDRGCWIRWGSGARTALRCLGVTLGLDQRPPLHPLGKVGMFRRSNILCMSAARPDKALCNREEEYVVRFGRNFALGATGPSRYGLINRLCPDFTGVQIWYFWYICAIGGILGVF